MLIDVKERMRKADTTPTIQCRVDAQIFEGFSTLAEHYKCSNAEFTKSFNQKPIYDNRVINLWTKRNIVDYH